jgi:hypothetical protein
VVARSRSDFVRRLWLTEVVKKLAAYGRDDHPSDDEERPQLAWAVAAMDDCDRCGDIRIELTLEELARPGTGLAAHLAPSWARALSAALATALRDVGERVSDRPRPRPPLYENDCTPVDGSPELGAQRCATAAMSSANSL